MMTPDEARDHFLKAKRLHWSDKTYSNYKKVAGRYITDCGVWPPTIQSILDWLGAVQGRASKTTAANYWWHLRAWLNWLELAGHLSDNPARQITLQPIAPKPVKRRKPIAFTKREIDELMGYLALQIETLANRRDLSLIRFAYHRLPFW